MRGPDGRDSTVCCHYLELDERGCFGSQWQASGRVGSVGIVTTWRLWVQSSGLLKVAVQFGLRW